MSNYTPISSRQLFHDLREDGLLIPRAGDGLFLTDTHTQIEDRLENYCQRTAERYDISDGLLGRWHQLGEAVSIFLSETSNSLWAEIYGAQLVDDVGEMLFGRNIRLELLRGRDHRRRFMVVGARGSARPAVGDNLRHLAHECLVTKLGFNSGQPDSLSLRLSAQSETAYQTLFGEPRRRLSDDSRPGILAANRHGVLFLDGLLGLDEKTQHVVIDLLDQMDASLDRGTMDAHLIVGARPAQTYGHHNTTVQALFQLTCRDGLIELPSLSDLIHNAADWKRIFSVLYREVARKQCGMSGRSLHQYTNQTAPDNGVTVGEAHREEQLSFLSWVADQTRIEAIQDVLYPMFSDYTWPGDLWELEALIRRVITIQDGPALSVARLTEHALAFRRRQPIADPETARQTEWLGRFEAQLEQLPFAEANLPQVLSGIESAYLKEAARTAAAIRAPKAARIQDVARMLGIPRQTASRKWQAYNLPAKLLTED